MTNGAVSSTPPVPPSYSHSRVSTASMGPPPLPSSPLQPSQTPYLHPRSQHSATCNTVLSRRRKRVFESVFPPTEAIATEVPTPVTSFTGSTQAGAKGRGLNRQTRGDGGNGMMYADTGETERDWNRNWHIVTDALRFEDGGFDSRPSSSTLTFITSDKGELFWTNYGTSYVCKKAVIMQIAGVEDGVRALLVQEAEAASSAAGGAVRVGPRAPPSLFDWYTWEVKRHYLAWVKPGVVDMLFALDNDTKDQGWEGKETRFRGILESLRCAWEVYVAVGKRWVFNRVNGRPGSVTPKAKGVGRVNLPRQTGQKLFGTGSKRNSLIGGASLDEEDDTEDDDDDEYLSLGTDGEGGEEINEVALAKFIRSLNSIISYSLTDPHWSGLVYDVFLHWCGVILNSPPGTAADDNLDGDEGNEDGGVGNDEMSVNQPENGIVTESECSTPKDGFSSDTLPKTPAPGIQSWNTQSPQSPQSPISPPATPVNHSMKYTKNQSLSQTALLTAWSHLQTLNLGGGGRRGERVFAEVISVLVTRYIEGMYATHWTSDDESGNVRDVTAEIGEWIENDVGRLVRLVLVGGRQKSKAVGKGRVRKRVRDRVLSPRASFRASELGIGGGSVKRRGGPRLSIDGVMLGTPTVTRRVTGLVALATLAGISVGKSIGDDKVRIKTKVEDVEEDVGAVVLRREDIEGWRKMALSRLGRLRVKELFEIVVDWPDSLGGVKDLRAYITTPQTRMHLTTTFTNAINTRILHPAASTTDILRVYISLIRAFAVLDPRGVLLDRVTRGIRRYLREREDTVRVIVKGLMGGDSSVIKHGPGDDEDHAYSGRGMEEDDLSDLAEDLMHGNTANPAVVSGGGDELDFDDMSWVPDPIDAGPEYRRIRGTDVVGSLISLYESKEVFVKEFQMVLAERLLECRDFEGIDEAVRNYEPEVQTLELLRVRFGEGPLQACDVMLRDIQNGARINANVRTEEGIDVEFHTKILSHLFWPAELEDGVVVSSGAGGWAGMGGWGAAASEEKKVLYKLPKEVKEMQKRYERGFEKLNGKRKLEWRDALGYVRVELELEDRVVEVRDARPWCVAVIHAFGEDAVDEGNRETHGAEQPKRRVRKNVKELKAELEMDEALIRRALLYWVAKGVLKELKPPPGPPAHISETYIVIECLDDTEPLLDVPIPTVNDTATCTEDLEGGEMDMSPDADPDVDVEPTLSPGEQVYANFIMGMLTNAPSAIGVERIMMMLGVLVPGGVRCGREKMGEILETLAREGKVERGEGGWKAKK